MLSDWDVKDQTLGDKIGTDFRITHTIHETKGILTDPWKIYFLLGRLVD